MIKKILFLAILLMVVFYNISLIYIDENLLETKETHAYNNCNKIWASRGLYTEHKDQNSITSMRRAFDAGASGAEVDFYYDVKMNKFIVSHDKPKKGEDGNLIYAKKKMVRS